MSLMQNFIIFFVQTVLNLCFKNVKTWALGEFKEWIGSKLNMSQIWLHGFEWLLTTIFNRYYTFTSSEQNATRAHLPSIVIKTMDFDHYFRNATQKSLMLVLIPNISLLPSTSLMISDVEIPTIIFL